MDSSGIILGCFTCIQVFLTEKLITSLIFCQIEFIINEISTLMRKKKWFNVFFDMKSMFNQLFYGEDLEFFNNKKNEKWDIQ
jgi:hypothetical protein